MPHPPKYWLHPASSPIPLRLPHIVHTLSTPRGCPWAPRSALSAERTWCAAACPTSSRASCRSRGHRRLSIKTGQGMQPLPPPLHRRRVPPPPSRWISHPSPGCWRLAGHLTRCRRAGESEGRGGGKGGGQGKGREGGGRGKKGASSALHSGGKSVMLLAPRQLAHKPIIYPCSPSPLSPT